MRLVVLVYLLAAIAVAVLADVGYLRAVHDEYEAITSETTASRQNTPAVKFPLTKLDVTANDDFTIVMPTTCILRRQQEDQIKSVATTGSVLSDVTHQAGLNFRFSPLGYCSNGDAEAVMAQRGPTSECLADALSGSVAVADYDRDGKPDVFLMGRLYRNEGDGTFRDVSVEAGMKPLNNVTGAVWIDVDGNGYIDLFVLNASGRYLYMNKGGRFVEEAIRRNLAPTFSGIQFMPAVGDFDLDGYADLMIAGLSASQLFHNKGKDEPGFFEEIYFAERGWNSSAFCASFNDFDNDGWPDLALTTVNGKSRLFWNRRGSLIEECAHSHCDDGRRIDAIGHCVGYSNRDEYLDRFLTGFNGSQLLVGKKGRSFHDASYDTGIVDGRRGSGSVVFDLNNDGYADIIAANGYRTSDVPLVLWLNDGNSSLTNTTHMLPSAGRIWNARGIAKLDYDGDGDEDILVASSVGEAVLYKNFVGNQNHWLRVRVLNHCPTDEAKLCDSLHARVTVTSPNGNIQVREIGSGAHFMAQNEIEAHFGLGSQPLPVNVRVFWPSLTAWMEYENVSPDRILQVVAPTKNRNSTVHYDQLDLCPRLTITQVTPSEMATISIGSDAQTISVVLNSATQPQTLRFEYTVQVKPSACLQCKANALVTLNVRSPNPSSFCSLTFSPPTSEWRLDGFSNNVNKNKTNWGAINQHLMRDVPSAYSNDLSAPAAQCTQTMRMNGQCRYPEENLSKGSTRPSARNVSNVLFSQPMSVPSARKLNDLATVFGQFLAHDTDLSTRSKRSGSVDQYGEAWMPITVPKGDIQFDPYSTGSEKIPFIRSTFDELCSGPTVDKPCEQTNRISSYIDGSLIYGHTEDIMTKLRSFKNGKLILQEGDFPPFNTMEISNDNPVGAPDKKLLAAGDSRINETPPLTALHTLFAREHNRQCDEYLRQHPGATDEETFQAARRIVVAAWQAITFREFLPAIIGRDLPPYTGYDANTNADVGNAFATAAFRYGHSQVNTMILRFDADWLPIPQGHLNLRDAFFSPERVLYEGGITPILRGAVYQSAQAVDTKMVDELRNFMFLKGKDETLDLASVNIQRGRDHGLPDYNSARKYLGLTRYSYFSQITDDVDVTAKLEELYGDINNVDLWVGGLAEKKVAGSELGELFETLFVKNFLRVRNGDRFWYEYVMTPQEISHVQRNLTMAHIIQLNSDFQDVPDDVFFSTKDCKSVRNHQCLTTITPAITVPTHTGSDCRRYFPATDTRRLDGFSNNVLLNKTTWGSNDQYLVRDVPSAYSDGLLAPAAQCTDQIRSASACYYPDENGGQGCTRPSPRVISNELFQQSEPVYSRRGLSDFSTVFGQFLAHDTDASTRLGRIGSHFTGSSAWFPISIPKGDNQFDPYNTGKEQMPFLRSAYDGLCSGPTASRSAEQINRISSYIDASMVYGSGNVATKLRSMKDGKLIVQEGNYPPYNNYDLPNDNPTGRPANELLVAGDVRINEQPTLIALHTLFLREHNRLCDEYLKKHSNATDETVYQAARRIVIAELQAITFREYLPAIIGKEMPTYDGYNPDVNADVGNAFATAAFRFGHSQVGSELWRLEADGSTSPRGHLNLRDAYFSPERVLREGGIDPLLRGAVVQRAQAVDAKLVDELRNVMFPKALRDTLDLVSINIQRGRDHGLPDFNSAKVHLKQKRYNSFSEMTSDPEVAQKLEQLYHDVDNVDLWVGGLAEKKTEGSELGPLFEKLLIMNFARVRDGDRFWYEKIMTTEEIERVHRLTMSEIIRKNSGYTDAPDNVFFATESCTSVERYQCVPVVFETESTSDILDSAKGVAVIVIVCLLVIVCSIVAAALAYVCYRRRKETKIKESKMSKQAFNASNTIVDNLHVKAGEETNL